MRSIQKGVIRTKKVIALVLFLSILSSLISCKQASPEVLAQASCLITRPDGILNLILSTAMRSKNEDDNSTTHSSISGTSSPPSSSSESSTPAISSQSPSSSESSTPDKNSHIISEEKAKEIWNTYLQSGAYRSQLPDDVYLKDLEYTVFDINADNIPELLIQKTTERPFFTTWVFVLQNTAAKMVHMKYGYGQFRYSKSQNAIIGSPDTKPFSGTGYSPFYRLEGTKLVSAFDIIQDEGVWTYHDEAGEKEISEEERQSYFEDIVDFEWLPISSDAETEPTAEQSESPNQSDSEFSEENFNAIAKHLTEAAEFAWKWFWDTSEINTSDVIRTQDDTGYLTNFYAITTEGITSKQALREYAHQHFTYDEIDKRIGMHDWIEQDGKLYVSETYGLGGLMEADEIRMEITPTADPCYVITLHKTRTLGNGELYSETKTFRYLLEDDDWVFDDMSAYLKEKAELRPY